MAKFERVLFDLSKAFAKYGKFFRLVQMRTTADAALLTTRSRATLCMKFVRSKPLRLDAWFHYV